MIVDSGKYYIYRHVTKDTKMVFYIGRGTKTEKDLFSGTYNRAFEKGNRNLFWKNLVNKHDYTIDIILESDDFYFICRKEKEFIKLYGRRNLNKGTLVNLSDGGETGGLGRIYKPSRETVEKIRIKQIGRKMPEGFGEIVTKRMIGNNYRTGNGNSKETNMANGRLHMISVYLYDLKGKHIKYFESVKSAAQEFKVHEATIIQCLQGKQKQSHGYQFRYEYLENCGKLTYKIKLNIPIECINIITNELLKFSNINEAAKILNISAKQVSHNLYGASIIAARKYKFNYLKIEEL